MEFNEVVQWVGTVFILAMYVVSNFYKEAATLRNGLALVGGLCFFIWSWRVANMQQMIINGVAITLCILGLLNVQLTRKVKPVIINT